MIPREDPGGLERATLVAMREKGNAIVVHDDFFWAGYAVSSLMEEVKQGTIKVIAEDEDNCLAARRPAFLLTPKGQPPDCFLVCEHLLNNSSNWRLFAGMVRAPANGTYGQKYSEPRVSADIATGYKVTMCGRLTALQRNQEKQPIDTLTKFVFVGVLEANLPNQKCYWALVHLDGAKRPSYYVGSLFGNDGVAHVHSVDEDNRAMTVDQDELASEWVEGAKVRV